MNAFLEHCQWKRNLFANRELKFFGYILSFYRLMDLRDYLTSYFEIKHATTPKLKSQRLLHHHMRKQLLSALLTTSSDHALDAIQLASRPHLERSIYKHQTTAPNQP